MPHLIVKDTRPGRRRRRCWRWTSEQKASYLDAFSRSDMSVEAFCDAMDLSPVTFVQWQRRARHAGSKLRPRDDAAAITFARVVACPPAEPGGGMRMIVRTATGHETALEGVDPTTAIHVVALLLSAGR